MSQLLTAPGARLARPAPGPAGLPVLGVIPQLRKGALQFFLNAAIEYGDVVRLRMGPHDMILISHPDHIKYVLQDNNKNYTKGYDKVKPLLGEGLVTSDGEQWLRQRRLMQPVFNHDRLDGFAAVMASQAVCMLERWLARPDPSQPLDIAAEMMELTQAIILQTMFSAEMGGESQRITQAFHDSLEYFNTILLRPVARVDRLPTPTNRRFHRAVRTLDDYIYRLIAGRRSSGEDAGDLLSMLIASRDEATGQGMPDRQIRDELMTIFLAGHETTANLLAWTWYLLSKHPTLERELRLEVETVLGGRLATPADLPRLVFTRMVLEESMRLYPPVWMFARSSIESDEIGGCYIPPHATLMLSPYVTHHLPAWWPNPEGFDPYRFEPDRPAVPPASDTAQTSEAVSRLAPRPKYAYFPFGGGPRQCIGNNFAMMEAQIILATVVQSCRLDLAPGAQVTPRPFATLRPGPSLPMTIRRLN